MQAVVLAGGFGTRLRPLTHTRPKALIPIVGRPMIDIALDQVSDAASEAYVAANYMVDSLSAHISSRQPPVTVVPEDPPRGTGGAVKNVARHLKGTFIVANGDVITTASVASLVDAHEESGAVATVGLTRVRDPTGLGVVDVDDRMRIRRFVEKPPPGEVASDLINAGIYVLEEEVLDLIPANEQVSMEREVFPQLAGKGLHGALLHGPWSDAGTLDGFLSAQAILLEDQHPEAEFASTPDTGLIPPVRVSRDAVVEDSTLGPNVFIAPGCRISGAAVSNAALMADVVVEPETTIADSVLGEGVLCHRGSHVQSSIVADRSNVTADNKLVGQREAGP